MKEELGRGGEAAVHRAVGPDGKDVAIKVWLHQGADPVRTRRRIAREAELVARIRHPGVVRLVDADVDAELPYLVFDYVDGSDLQQWLATRGPLRGEQARRVIVGILAALVEIHAAPVAHLDLKPANILLRTTVDGLAPVIVDFGIARLTDATHTRFTGQSTAFASPEQLLLDTAYTPSDLFSYASCVYYLVTGEAPFGTEPAAARSRILDRDWLPPRGPFDEAMAKLAPGLWDTLVDCWHRDPVLRVPLMTHDGRLTRPVADTHTLMQRVEHAFSDPRGTRLRRGRVNPHRPGPTSWHELGAHLRHRRRHGDHPMTRRQMVSQRELLGRLTRGQLWAYEMGWLEPPYDIVAIIDSITGGQGFLKHLYACARNSDVLGLPGRPRGSRYPVAGDASAQHEEMPAALIVSPWEEVGFPVMLRNTGTVVWSKRYLVPTGPITGTETVPVRGSRFVIPDTPPGGVARLEIPLRAPGWPSVYRQRFKMVDEEGEFCFPTGNVRGVEAVIQVVPRDA